MSESLLENRVGIIEPSAPFDGHWCDSREANALPQRAAEHRHKGILERVGSDSENKREKAEKLVAEAEAADRAKVAKAEKRNELIRRTQAIERIFQGAKHLHDHAQGRLDEIDYTIELWFFDGKHPTLGRDAPPLLAINTASQRAGAQRVIELYAPWLKQKQAELAKIEAAIDALTKELGL